MERNGGSTIHEADMIDPDARIELTAQGQRLLQRLLAEASAEIDVGAED